MSDLNEWNPGWKAPRNGLLWLLVAFVAVIVPQVQHMPFWVIVAALTALVWRVQIYRGTWRYPGRWAKMALLLFCIAGLLLTYGRLYGLEPMVALLITAFSLKLLEMHSRRDALILVFLGYFVAIIFCLFLQTISAAAYVLFCLGLVTAGLVGLHQTGDARPGGLYSPWQPLRMSTVLVLQAIPLMIVLFLVMPRMSPLWSVPSPQGQATTGMSDSMSPGDFTRLGRSGKLAFRVEFDGSIPPQRELYWRGLVFSNFDGRSWQRSSQTPDVGRRTPKDKQLFPLLASDVRRQTSNRRERQRRSATYQVTLEPTNNHWLFALPVAEPLTPSIQQTPDFRLVTPVKISARTRYSVRSWLDHPRDADGLSSWQRRAALRLPEGFNPETRRIAQQWLRENPDPQALIDKALALFNREFVYTLEPPALGRHSVDEFLWQTQRGFCEHFASSFVFLMRAAGVPARVVAGYQGGEKHPTENYLLVHQYDAHAWAEVWLPGRGWVRVDPTAAVAPERIESSFADVLGREAGFLSDTPFSLIRFRHINLLNNLRLKLDYLDYVWAKGVLGYQSVQTDVLTRLLGGISPWRMGLFLVVAGGIALLPLLLSLLWLRRGGGLPEADRLFLRFCQRLAKAGLPRRQGEGPRDYAKRVARERPELTQQVIEITEIYEKIRFDSDNQHQHRLKYLVHRFRFT